MMTTVLTCKFGKYEVISMSVLFILWKLVQYLLLLTFNLQSLWKEEFWYESI
jgi:hypothetical protein